MTGVKQEKKDRLEPPAVVLWDNWQRAVYYSDSFIDYLLVIYRMDSAALKQRQSGRFPVSSVTPQVGGKQTADAAGGASQPQFSVKPRMLDSGRLCSRD